MATLVLVLLAGLAVLSFYTWKYNVVSKVRDTIVEAYEAVRDYFTTRPEYHNDKDSK